MKNTISLNQNTLFKRLYFRGKAYHNPYFVFYILPNGQNLNRLGFTVSKKIGKAVVRNHTRRLLYEAYRYYEDKLNIGFNIVIVAKSNILKADFQEIRASLGGVLKKAGLFK